MSDLHITGLADLQKMLDTLPAKLEANVMRGALRAGAKVISTEAKRLVPVHSGALRDSIRVSAKIKGGRVIASVKAGSKETKKTVTTKPGGGISVGYQNPFYAHFVEFGTAAHFVKSEKKKDFVLVPNKRASSGFAKRLSITSQIGKMHPGAKAHPFMRPALDARAQDAIVAAGEYIKKRLSTKEGLDTSDIEIGAEE